MQNCNSKSKTEIKKRTYSYALDAIKFIEQLPRNNSSTRGVANQLLRSATSIGANIIEVQASSSKKEFTNFLNYALKSANESKFWLALLRDPGKAKKELVDNLLSEPKQPANILASSILTVKVKRGT